jgi:hypothetical protein
MLGTSEAKQAIEYLVELADWCAGMGICQIEGIEDPEEWLYRLWSDHGPAGGEGYSAEAVATLIKEPIND